MTYFVFHHGALGKMNACRALTFFSFLVSCLPQRYLLQSQTVTALCASPGRGSPENINLILLMKTLLISDMSAVLEKRFKTPFFFTSSL